MRLRKPSLSSPASHGTACEVWSRPLPWKDDRSLDNFNGRSFCVYQTNQIVLHCDGELFYGDDVEERLLHNRKGIPMKYLTIVAVSLALACVPALAGGGSKSTGTGTGKATSTSSSKNSNTNVNKTTNANINANSATSAAFVGASIRVGTFGGH